MAELALPQPLTPAQLQEVNDHLAALRTLLTPYFTALSTEQIRQLTKMGEKSIPFVQEALAASQNNTGTLPGDFSVSDFTNALSLATQLSAIDMQLKQLETGVGNTATVAGSTAMNDANQAYSYLKTGARTNPALKPVVAQLAERYKKSRAKTPVTPS